MAWFIQSAKQANMNILRIWGGGVYFDNNLYELGDKEGVMFWQDMMFSCKVYPTEIQSFVDNSVIEVREQVGRL